MAIYTKTIWANNITPLNQENMNHIEDGIYTVSLESEASLTSVSYNTLTNQLSYTYRNNTTTNIVEIYDVTKVYSKTQINDNFQEIEIDED